MIISKAPLRISVGGGGTDLPSYYTKNNGTTFSSLALNKHIFVSINTRFEDNFFIRYAENEKPGLIQDISHPIIKETLIDLDLTDTNIEITSTSDIPSGTGLGSSGTFGVALQLAMRKYLNMEYDNEILAKESTRIEKDILERPIGLQDQYIASYGGLTEFIVDSESNVIVKQRMLSKTTEKKINNSLFLIFSNLTRSSTMILSSDAEEMSKKSNTKTYESIIDLGKAMFSHLGNGEMKEYGELMHEYWLIKRQRQEKFTDTMVNEIYDYLKAKDLIHGGKLVGAGGSGFLLVSSDKKDDLLSFAKEKKMIIFPVEIDHKGADLVVY